MSDHWDRRYAEPGFAYGTEPNDFLRAMIDRLPVGRALSLAEGEGRNAVFLATHGFDVAAVDRSRVGLEKAATLASEAGVTIRTVHADLADFAIAPESVEVVIAIWCHLPAPLRRKIHRAATLALVQGGALLLEAYRPEQLAFKTGGPPVVDLLYTLDELRDDFAGLDLVHAANVEREVHEGRYHSGKSAVVQILGYRRRAAS